MQYIMFIPIVITVVSIVINIIQYQSRQREICALKAHLQEDYNAYFDIARACARARNRKEDIRDFHLLRELEYIRGVSDARRHGIIAYGREHLSFIPFYEHVMHPGKSQPDEIMRGMTPEEYSRQKDEKYKKEETDNKPDSK
jgi:hypothetical protein